MADFHQNGIITTLHDFSNRSLESMERELKLFSSYRPMELILPSLYSELEGPALEKIILEISKVNYLNFVVIGLDRSNKDEYEKAKEFFSVIKIPHKILWHDGPNLMKLHSELEQKGIAPKELGKGRNVWYCMGYILARGKAEAVALHDCDILTYDRSMLAKLFYPIANPNFNFEFCKGYYPRIAEGKLNGRVTRLLVTPLLIALERVIGRHDYIDFMKSFRYPLAGEFSFRRESLRLVRVPYDWGLEIGILSEMHRNHSKKGICQVDIASSYDHKHQDLSETDDKKGLSKMSIDITKALIRKLATQGITFSNETFRSIKATYYRKALDFIELYNDDATINGLKLDIHQEEKAVELFAENIMKAGETFLDLPMETPFIPTWNRVLSAAPNFLDRLYSAVEKDSK